MSQVLLVDDEKNVLTSLGIGLRRAGYSVRAARSGPEALRMLEEAHSRVVISDIRMWPMDGYTLAQEIHRQYPEIKIILMSAFDIDEEKQNHLKFLTSRRLVKPFSVETLLQVLRDELESTCRILVVSGYEVSEQLIRNLESDGFVCTLCEDYTEIAGRFSREIFDIFLIDGDYLNGKFKRVLNELNKWFPGRPVVILSTGDEYSAYGQQENFTCAVVDRTSFLEDFDWGAGWLRNLLGNA